jgi:sec-independent protein translocase protein TatA
MQNIQHAQLFSGGHILLILLIVVLLFGGRKIPELMRGLGQGIKEFKDASKSEDKKDNASPDKQIEEK